MRLDLHGYTVHNAWKEWKSAVEQAWWYDAKTIIVITGHGKIAQELPKWCTANPYVRTCELNSPNTGAYKLTLWKRKP